jgi:hypothetical protein
MTRALASVLYLDFESAWGYHRGVVVVAPLLVWLWVKWIYKELPGVEPRNGENNK